MYLLIRFTCIRSKNFDEERVLALQQEAFRNGRIWQQHLNGSSCRAIGNIVECNYRVVARVVKSIDEWAAWSEA